MSVHVKTRVDPLLTSWVRDVDRTITDEELAAKVIVQMTLFIATQVAYSYTSSVNVTLSYM